MRVLVMDDDPEVREVLVDLLRSLGHDAVGAADAREVEKIVREAATAKRPFDAALLDIQPDGVEAAGILLRLAPGTVRIAISGTPSPPMMSPTAHGFTRALPKPIGRRALERSLTA